MTPEQRAELRQIAEYHERLADLDPPATAFNMSAAALLRTLAAAPSVEPVAWMRSDGAKAMTDDERAAWLQTDRKELVSDYTTPLYAAPPEQAEPPPVVPAGWKVVPVEPTREMLNAYVDNNTRFATARSDWAAMLSAAPQSPAREPLTHMQTVTLWGHRSDGPSNEDIVSFASAIERAHGIGAK